MCEHNQEQLPCYGCIQELQAKGYTYTPRHQQRTNSYYVTRSVVRGIVWTFLAITAVTVFAASVIILGVVF